MNCAGVGSLRMLARKISIANGGGCVDGALYEKLIRLKKRICRSDRERCQREILCVRCETEIRRARIKERQSQLQPYLGM
jgi:hypothetical protein